MPPFRPPHVRSVSSLRRGQLFTRRQSERLYAWWRRVAQGKSCAVALPFLLEDLSTQAAIRWANLRTKENQESKKLARGLWRKTLVNGLIHIFRSAPKVEEKNETLECHSANKCGAPTPVSEQNANRKKNDKRLPFIPEDAWRLTTEDLIPYTQDIRAWLRFQGRKVRRARQEANSQQETSWGTEFIEDIGDHVAKPLNSTETHLSNKNFWRELPENMRPHQNSHLLPRFSTAQRIWLASLGGPPATSTALYTGNTDSLVSGFIKALGLNKFGQARPVAGALSTLWSVVHVLTPNTLLWFLATFTPELHAFGGDAMDRAYWFKDGAEADRWLSEGELEEQISTKPETFSRISSANVDGGPEGCEHIQHQPDLDQKKIDDDIATLAAIDVDQAATRTVFPWGPGQVQLSALSHMFLHCASSFLNGPNAFMGEERQELIDLMVLDYPRQLYDVLMHDIESHEIGKQWLTVCGLADRSALPATSMEKLTRTQERLGEVLTNPEVIRRVVPMVADSCSRLGIKPTDAVLTLMERAFMIRKLARAPAEITPPKKRRLM